MVYSRLEPIVCTAGLCLVGALAPAQAYGAEPGWLPVVIATDRTPSPQSRPIVPRLPRARRAPGNAALPVRKGAAGDVAADVSARRPAAPSSVGSIPPTRMLSASDSARLKVVETGQIPHPNEGAAGVTIPDSDLAQRYCVNVTDAAADARIAWQQAKLAETEQEIGKRIAALEAKTAEYKAWLERRNEFSRKATETLVQIYAQMEPDSAALQLAAMNEETAAAILVKLDPPASGAILNEMQPDKAARLSGTIAGAARVAQKRPAAAPAPAGDAAAPRAANRGGGS
jgi:flagellar motility protein MotE (MotC chaperone)